VIVIDASAAVSALLTDGQARRLCAVESVHAPHLVDAEVSAHYVGWPWFATPLRLSWNVFGNSAPP
jgi:hypothetical protein